MQYLTGVHKIKIDQNSGTLVSQTMYSARKLPPMSSTSQEGFECLPSLVSIWQSLNDLLPNKQQGYIPGWVDWQAVLMSRMDSLKVKESSYFSFLNPKWT